MTLLTPIIIVPLLAGLACLLVRSHRLMGLANVFAFGVILALGVELLREVLAQHVVSECGEFFRADALPRGGTLGITVSDRKQMGRYRRRPASGMAPGARTLMSPMRRRTLG